MKTNKNNEVLTTVYISKQNFIDFKKKCIDENITLKYVINKTIELFINDDDDFVNSYYLNSGSLN